MTFLRLFSQLVRHRPWVYVGLVVFVNLFVVGRLVPGLMEKAIFDRLAGTTTVGFNAYTLIAILVSLELARLATSLVWVATETTVQYSVGGLLRYNLMRQVLKRPGAAALDGSPSEVLSRFRDDVDDILTFITSAAMLVGSLVFSIVALTVMLRIHARLTLVVVVPLILVIAVAAFANNRVRRYRVASREATARITGFLGEVFESVMSIKLLGAERHVFRRFGGLNEVRARATVKDTVFTQALTSMFYNTVDIGTGLILLLAAQPMLTGEFTVGDFALFDYYLFFVTRLPLRIGAFLVEYRQATVAAGRLLKLAGGEEPEVLTRGRAGGGTDGMAVLTSLRKAPEDRLERLDVSGLAYHYPGSERGIRDVGFALERGSFTVVTGRVGCGKTTLLQVLLGLLPRDAGEIRWNGRLVEDPASFLVPPRCAYASQVPYLSSDTVRDNILMGLAEEHVDLDGALRAAAFVDDVRDLSQGLDTRVGPRGVKLSGGQVQRVAAARLFVRDPELVVVDDFASAVDSHTERALLRCLEERRGSSTMLLASHRSGVLEAADEVIVMADGRILARGRLRDLLVDCEEMQRLWHELAHQ